jgi:hypothetical protein
MLSVYNRSQERAVFVASLPFMAAAKAQAVSRGMNDHGPLHAQRVYALMGHLSALVTLNSRERDLGLAAALLHDIGMAKDRENHHTVAASLVKELAAEGALPFDAQEAAVVSRLCEWHRRDYDPDAVDNALGVRTGVVASLLRLADALDLDYRRSEDYPTQEPVITHLHEGQAQHHLSVRNILGIRFHASGAGTEVQLLVDQVAHAGLQLARLVEELVGTPIAWPVKLIPVRRHAAGGLAFNTLRHAAVFSYCNAHGIVQAGISKQALGMAGFSTNVVCDMSRTGNPPQFWATTVPGFDFSVYQLVAILDLDLPSDLDVLVRLVRSHPTCRWVYSTPLEQAPEKLAALIDVGVDVLVGDARVLFAGDALVEHGRQWTRIAGLCNADDWLTSTGGFDRREFRASRGLRLELLRLTEAGAGSEQYSALVSRVANGELDAFAEQELEWEKTLEARMPRVTRVGRVLQLEEASLPGRFTYDLAHLAIERHGVLAWEHNEFATPYAICRKHLADGRERILYLSRFGRSDGAVPVKYFVPYAEAQLGSGATIWQTYVSPEAANEAIKATTQRINEFFRCDD